MDVYKITKEKMLDVINNIPYMELSDSEKNCINDQAKSDEIFKKLSIYDDLMIHSLDALDLIMQLEEEFDIDLDNSIIDNPSVTVKDLVEIVEQKIKEK